MPLKRKSFKRKSFKRKSFKRKTRKVSFKKKVLRVVGKAAEHKEWRNAISQSMDTNSVANAVLSTDCFFPSIATTGGSQLYNRIGQKVHLKNINISGTLEPSTSQADIFAIRVHFVRLTKYTNSFVATSNMYTDVSFADTAPIVTSVLGLKQWRNKGVVTWLMSRTIYLTGSTYNFSKQPIPGVQRFNFTLPVNKDVYFDVGETYMQNPIYAVFHFMNANGHTATNQCLIRLNVTSTFTDL